MVRPHADMPALELTRALGRAAEVERLAGARARAAVLDDLARAAGAGRLAERVGCWTRGPETVLFAMAGRTAEVHRLFDAAALVAESEGRIASAVRGALIGPVLMALALVALLVMLGTELFPQLDALSGAETWGPVARVLYATGSFIGAAGFRLVPVPFVLWGVLRLVQARWTGRGRVTADRVPPFRFMALSTGAAFLLVVAELARMREELTPARFRALAGMAATPYERNRIGAIATALERAPNPGRAALAAGGRWPDVEMCAVLDAFAGQGLWAEPFRAFVVAWVAQAGERVETAAKVVTFALMAVIAGVVAGVILAVFDIVQQLGSPGG